MSAELGTGTGASSAAASSNATGARGTKPDTSTSFEDNLLEGGNAVLYR